MSLEHSLCRFVMLFISSEMPKWCFRNRAPSHQTFHTSEFAILCLTCFYPACLDSTVMIEEGM